MSAPFQTVPWFNIQEWQEVYDKVYLDTSTVTEKQKALNHLLIWKARCPSLPPGIESTLTLLEVHVQDLNKNTEACGDQIIRLAYSSALMRFVNHMLYADTARGLTLYQAAKNSGIPDWIIELRHDTAHSDGLPPLDLLREATLTSLEWLQHNYWNKHKQSIENFVVGKLQDGGYVEDKIEALINFCISLSICSHSKCSIKNVSDITDETLRNTLINDAKDLFGENVDFTNLVSIKFLIETMNSKSKKILNHDLVSKIVNKFLLSDESLFLSLELHSLFDKYNSDCTKPLCKQYVQCFEGLLNFLHLNDLLEDFIMDLIKFTYSHEYIDGKCKLAAQWVSIIVKALKNNQIFMEKIYETETKNLTAKDRKEVYSMFYHWFPNKKQSVVLDLRRPVPKNFTNISYIQPIISTYNPNLIYFIKDLLNLIQPCLPVSVVHKICELANIVATPEKYPVVSSRIYTVEDIKSANVSDLSSDINEVEILEINTIKDNQSITEKGQLKFGFWQISSKSSMWSTCPIGQLPWQLNQLNDPMNN